MLRFHWTGFTDGDGDQNANISVSVFLPEARVEGSVFGSIALAAFAMKFSLALVLLFLLFAFSSGSDVGVATWLIGLGTLVGTFSVWCHIQTLRNLCAVWQPTVKILHVVTHAVLDSLLVSSMFAFVFNRLSITNYSRKRHALRWNLLFVPFNHAATFCWSRACGGCVEFAGELIFAHVCNTYLELLRLSLLCRLVRRGGDLVNFRLASRTQFWYWLHMNTNTIGYPKPNNSQSKQTHVHC